ncbi:MAG TPA: uroporphyrinogen-III synthase [Xanthomonadaceae bacterium]|nr:uroporphyrinogen-III synthase [Xanthomonadaceae bacterium]
MRETDRSPLTGRWLISLRPAGQHGPVRRAAAAHGARVLALSPWRLQRHDDAATRAALADALRCGRIVFSSPEAVRAASALQPLRASARQTWLAVGSGTGAALRRAGIAGVLSPLRMDSAGLLDLEELCEVSGARIGLVTAPGGRDRIAAGLRQRGATVLRADVYKREPCPLGRAGIDRLLAVPTPGLVLLSSAGALRQVLADLPEHAAAVLRRCDAIAASPRLAAIAGEEAGMRTIAVASDPRPRAMLAAAAAALTADKPMPA